MDVIQEIERQLLMVLLENIPEPAARPKRENESLLNGPQLLTPVKRAWWQTRIRWTICWTVLVSDCPSASGCERGLRLFRTKRRKEPE